MSKIETLVNKILIKNKYKSKDREWKTWVFGEWFGERCDDSCMVLANYIAEKDNEIKLYWIAKASCKGLEKLNNRIKVIKMDSDEAIDILSKAGVVFVNEGLIDLSEHGNNYSAGALIINLWHGVPWKKIGLDSYKKTDILGRVYFRATMRLQGFDYFLSTSEKCSKAIKSGFIISAEELIYAGLPRNEAFHNAEKIAASRKKIKSLVDNSLPLDDKTIIIAYMPTFRDEIEEVFDFNDCSFQTEINTLLEEKNAIIIQKKHLNSQRRLNYDIEESSGARVININDISAQELMASSDILITDYSSCFFDYLLLDRPIIHYLYDYEYYSNKDRGLYYSKEEIICGDAPSNEEELIKAIKEAIDNPHKDKDLRLKRIGEFWEYNSPSNCERIEKFIMNKIPCKIYDN